MNGLQIDVEKGKKVAPLLFDQFNSVEGIFGKTAMPEDLICGSNEEGIKIERNSYEYLMFITLVVSIDYMRDADKLWAAARLTVKDRETKWLFYPDSVRGKPLDELVAAMKKHRLSQKHTRDASLWKTISESFARYYASDPRKLVEECGYDALRLYERKYDTRFKKNFPFLSGDKIFPLWIRMLHDNLGIDLVDLDKVPIPVDVHIARATFTTGSLIGEYEGSKADAAENIAEAWKKIVAGVRHPKLKYALQMDEVLWQLSKNGCKFRKEYGCPKHNQCPVGKYCVPGLVKVSTQRIVVRTGLPSG